MKLKKALAVLLAVGMTLGLAACAPESAKWVGTVDGQNVPAGLYIAYMMDAYSEASGKVAEPAKDVLKQQVDTTPAADWITTRTDELLRTHYAVERQFTEQGLTLSADDTLYAEQEMQYWWQMYGSIYEKNGISTESYQAKLLNRYKQDALFMAEFGPEGKTPVSTEELTKQFTTDYFRARYITAGIVDSTGAPLAEEDKQKVIAKLQVVLDSATASGDFGAAILASEKEQAIASGQDETTVHTHDENSHTSDLDRTSASYTPEFLAEVDAMKANDIKIITTETTAYLLQKLELDPANMENYRGVLLDRLKGDAFEAEIATWTAAVDVQFDSASKGVYKPSKLKFS